MSNERVQEYYDILKSFYLKTDSDWTDKAKSIRTVTHEFFNEFTETHGTFANALKEFYRWNLLQDVTRQYYYIIKDSGEFVKNRLNTVVHQNKKIDKETFVGYYTMIVQLIYFATGVYPDKATQEFIGCHINDELDGLNDEQKDAVLCDAKIIYVNAGPGTGKTHLLINKLLHYINTSSSIEKIVALSYTNTASFELGEKFHKAAFENGISKTYEFYNGTLHSFCFKMMKSYFAVIGKEFNYIIIDDADIEDLSVEFQIQTGFQYSKDEIKACLQSKFQTRNPQLAKLVADLKARYEIISIDDILANFIELHKDVNFRNWCKAQVSILVIDEAQDLSKRNYQIFDLLLEVNPDIKLFLVGDPRQSIFGFIGGAYKHLVDFLGHHSNSVRKNLTGTYRCPQPVCDYVNRFKFIDCDNPPLTSIGGSVGQIKAFSLPSIEREASRAIEIVEQINDINKTAILCQNLRYLETLFNELSKTKIPYKVFGGQKLVKRHIRIFNHLLRIIDSVNNYSIQSIKKEYSIKYDKASGKNEVERFFNTEGGRFLKDVRDDIERRKRNNEGFSMDALASTIIDFFFDSASTAIQDDLLELKKIIAQYSTINEYLLSFAIDREKFSLFFDKNYEECKVPINDKFLTVTTIHSAKGMQWDNVIIMGMSDENFPNMWFAREMDGRGQSIYINDHLKMMYVAATRTKENLFMTYARFNARGFKQNPSRFLACLKP